MHNKNPKNVKNPNRSLTETAENYKNNVEENPAVSSTMHTHFYFYRTRYRSS